MKILVVLGEDTFRLDSIDYESYRDGSVRHVVKYNKEFLEKVISSEELVEAEDFTFIKAMSFVDGTNYYKISYRNKTFDFKPKEVFFS